MKKLRLFLIVMALCLDVPCAMSHGRSEIMAQELNAKAPEWLSIGVPIRAELVNLPASDQSVFRSRSGGATNSRNRVHIPNRGIEIEVGYEIDWTGANEAGSGVSLSPDGKKLIINSGPTSHLYEIHDNGDYREVPLRIPHVTYDSGLKGYLREWSWADDQTLVARGEITDEAGHEIIENRIYVFHMREGVLSRLDLSALGLSNNDGIKVIGIGSDLNQVKLSAGDALVVAKVDLKSPPKIQNQTSSVPKATGPTIAPTQSFPTTPGSRHSQTTPSEQPASSTPWSIIFALILAAICLLMFLMKRGS